MLMKKKRLVRKFLISIAVGFLSLATNLTITIVLNYGVNIITVLQWLFISSPGILLLIAVSGEC